MRNIYKLILFILGIQIAYLVGFHRARQDILNGLVRKNIKCEVRHETVSVLNSIY